MSDIYTRRDRAELAVVRENLARARGAAQAVVSLRHADDVAFRAAVNVLLVQVLGPGAFDATVTEDDALRNPDGLSRCEECGCGSCKVNS